MKVLMFGWEFPPYFSGGLGTACLGLTRHIAGMGVDILFVMPKAPGDAVDFEHFELRGANEVELSSKTSARPEELSEATVTVLEVDSLLEPYSSKESYQTRQARTLKEVEQLKTGPAPGRIELTGGYGKDLLEEVSRYAVVGSQLGAREKFDVIHTHDWMTYPAGVEAKLASGKALICHVHATEYDRAGDNADPEICAIEKYGLEAADRVLTVSQRAREIVLKHYAIAPEKVFVVHNAVSKERHIKRDQIKRNFPEKLVLFLGRVTSQKGPEYFVEAARLVLKELPEVRFVMAGSGDMLGKIIERIAQLRLQKQFHFTGFLHHHAVEQIFALSDVYVMPSVSDPFGITPFEAMLYHVPVIVSKQSGVTEVLQHAIKVDFWDVHELARSIIKVLTDEEFARRLAEEGAKELDHVSWDTAARKIIAHYRELAPVQISHNLKSRV